MSKKPVCSILRTNMSLHYLGPYMLEATESFNQIQSGKIFKFAFRQKRISISACICGNFMKANLSPLKIRDNTLETPARTAPATSKAAPKLLDPKVSQLKPQVCRMQKVGFTGFVLTAAVEATPQLLYLCGSSDPGPQWVRPEGSRW